MINTIVHERKHLFNNSNKLIVTIIINNKKVYKYIITYYLYIYLINYFKLPIIVFYIFLILCSVN